MPFTIPSVHVLVTTWAVGFRAAHGTSYAQSDLDGRLTVPLCHVQKIALAHADVAADSTCLATIAQRALRQGCWGNGVILWRLPPHTCAERQELGLPRSCSFVTWTGRG